MPIFQSYNHKIKRWVKYKSVKGQGAKILEVKKNEPNKPFKKTPKKK